MIFKGKKTADHETIVIVSGLPRSGTSMMMKMLASGGLQPVTDNLRIPDTDNPKGYFEFEKVKRLAKDNSFLMAAKGRVVKVISLLLKYLPQEYFYKVIFMQRNMDEILASQKEMAIRRGKYGDDISDDEMSKNFNLHLKKVEDWLAQQPNFNVIYVNYNEVLKNYYDYIKKINAFLGGLLDVDKMSGCVDHTLYRNRH